MPTMNDVYMDDSDHECCNYCGFCITCKDCEKYGCGRELKHEKFLNEEVVPSE